MLLMLLLRVSIVSIGIRKTLCTAQNTQHSCTISMYMARRTRAMETLTLIISQAMLISHFCAHRQIIAYILVFSLRNACMCLAYAYNNNNILYVYMFDSGTQRLLENDGRHFAQQPPHFLHLWPRSGSSQPLGVSGLQTCIFCSLPSLMLFLNTLYACNSCARISFVQNILRPAQRSILNEQCHIFWNLYLGSMRCRTVLLLLASMSHCRHCHHCHYRRHTIETRTAKNACHARMRQGQSCHIQAFKISNSSSSHTFSCVCVRVTLLS